MRIEQRVALMPGKVLYLRAFRDEDYPRLAEIKSLAFPDRPRSAEEIRRADASWDRTRCGFLRLAAEDAGGAVVGVGRIRHEPWAFHPRGYSLNVTVEPALRRRGIGTAIYGSLIVELRRRGVVAVRTWVARDTMTQSIAFLWHRGFVEVQRGRQSHIAFEKAPV